MSPDAHEAEAELLLRELARRQRLEAVVNATRWEAYFPKQLWWSGLSVVLALALFVQGLRLHPLVTVTITLFVIVFAELRRLNRKFEALVKLRELDEADRENAARIAADSNHKLPRA